MKWNTDYIVHQTEGGVSAQARGVDGIQPDQGQGHYHTFSYQVGNVNSNTGAYGRIITAAPDTNSSGNVTAMVTDGTNGTPRKGTFTHPRNRLVRYYKRDS